VALTLTAMLLSIPASASGPGEVGLVSQVLGADRVAGQQTADPCISSFSAVQVAGNVWTLQGMVANPDPDGMTVVFSGLVSGSTPVQADGSFSLSVQLPPGQNGTEVAELYDSWGESWDAALDYIWQS
jgi:hypothetical protein